MNWLADIPSRLIAYALALAFAFGGWWLWWGARDDLIAYRAEVAALGAKAQADADAQDAEWQSQLEEARNDAKKREAVISAAAAGARSERDRLRDEIKRLNSLPIASADAERDAATRARAAFERVAEAAERTTGELELRQSELREQVEAWPR